MCRQAPLIRDALSIQALIESITMLVMKKVIVFHAVGNATMLSLYLPSMISLPGYLESQTIFDLWAFRRQPKMKVCPSYGKVFSLGSMGTERSLVGPVVVQEKVDGSQFAFGVNEDGELVMRSHHQAIHAENCPNQFQAAMGYVKSLDLGWLPRDVYFYCEMLAKPHHNTITYERVPKNHLVLFDASYPAGWFDNRDDLASFAEHLGIDVVPELYYGKVSLETLRNLLQMPSYLGGSTVEGVVVKNYHETVAPGNRLQPLFVKLVNEQFKERNRVEFKGKTVRGTVEDYVASFQSEARWVKAVQHLRDQGLLVGEPKDIGLLVKEVDRDLKEEEAENIKAELYKLVIGEVLRKAKMGLPEWYKSKLIEWNVTP
jgi:hypothetical protein